MPETESHGEHPMWQFSHDLSDEFFGELVDMCKRLDCKPHDLAGCWMSESNVTTRAHNPAGATGLFQVIPSTLRGLGFQGDWKAFQALSDLEQLAWAEKYYRPHKGRLVSMGACYLATFLPALMSHAGEPTFVLCGQHGPFAFAYAGNAGAFDPHQKGWITVQDLTDRIERVTTGPRWQEISDRIKVAMEARTTEPILPVAEEIAKGDPPVFLLPDYDDEPKPPPDDAA